jgi:hypothetical protein
VQDLHGAQAAVAAKRRCIVLAQVVAAVAGLDSSPANGLDSRVVEREKRIGAVVRLCRGKENRDTQADDDHAERGHIRRSQRSTSCHLTWLRLEIREKTGEWS